MSRVTLPDSASDACGTARDQADAAAGDVRFGRERQARLLLEHVEDRLQRSDRAVPDRLQSLLDPADRGSERDAELADLALDAELFQLGPEVVGEDRLDARVVQLVEVDPVGAEAAQRRVELGADRLGPPVVRPFRLARVLALGLDVVAALRREHDLVAVRLQQIREQGLAEAVTAVDRCGVDEVDAGVESGVEQAELVVDLAPPVAG